MERRIKVRFEGDSSGLVSELKKVGKATDETQQKTGGLGKKFGGLKAAFAAAGVVAATAAITKLGVETFKLGAAVAETSSKFRTVFGPANKDVDKFIDSFGRMAGVSRTAGRNMLATTGAIVQGMGMAQEKSAGFSQEIFKLAGDMASFNNLPTADVIHRINSALTGERESLKRMGVVITEVEVQQLSLLQTGKERVSQITQEEKAQATLTLINQKAGVAVGDLARTQNSAANQAKRMSGDFQTIKETVSAALLPALQSFAGVINRLAGAFRDNEETIKKWARGAGVVILALFEAVKAPFKGFMAMFRFWKTIVDEGLGGAKDAIKQYVVDVKDVFAEPVEAVREYMATFDELATITTQTVVPAIEQTTAALVAQAEAAKEAGKELLKFLTAHTKAQTPELQDFTAARRGRLAGVSAAFQGTAFSRSKRASAQQAAAAHAAEEAQREARKQMWDDLNSNVQRFGRQAIELGSLFGALKPKIAAGLNSLLTAFQSVAGGIAQGGLMAGLTGGLSAIPSVINAISSLFGGGGPSRHQRLLEAQDALRVSTFGLMNDFERLAEVASNLGDEMVGKLSEMASKLGVFVSTLFPILHPETGKPYTITGGWLTSAVAGSGGGGGLKGFDLAGQKQLEELRKIMKELGISTLDIFNAAKELGFDISNLMSVLITGKGDASVFEAASSELNQLMTLLAQVAAKATGAAVDAEGEPGETRSFLQNLQISTTQANELMSVNRSIEFATRRGADATEQLVTLFEGGVLANTISGQMAADVAYGAPGGF